MSYKINLEYLVRLIRNPVQSLTHFYYNSTNYIHYLNWLVSFNALRELTLFMLAALMKNPVLLLAAMQ
jgi:hypothetical protein